VRVTRQQRPLDRVFGTAEESSLAIPIIFMQRDRYPVLQSSVNKVLSGN
jgi:hypothetical protein